MLWLRPGRWWSCTRPSHGGVVDPQSGECRCWHGHGAHKQAPRDDADRVRRGGDDHGERIRACSESTRKGTSAVTSSAIATQGIHLLAWTSLSTYRIIPQWIPMPLTRKKTTPSPATSEPVPSQGAWCRAWRHRKGWPPRPKVWRSRLIRAGLGWAAQVRGSRCVVLVAGVVVHGVAVVGVVLSGVIVSRVG